MDPSSSHRRRVHRQVLVVGMLIVALAGCAGDSNGTPTTPVPATDPSTAESQAFPTAAFADLSEQALPPRVRAALRQALMEAALTVGMTATVMTPDGTWTGATGTADDTQPMTPQHQMAIGSITKTIVAAQVMQLVEDGALSLDDKAEDYLPESLDFDSNGATVGDLMGMRSGIPDYGDVVFSRLSTDKLRVWTTDDLLALIGPDRAPVDSTFDYSSTNYLLLGLIIEEVTGRPVADVLREGVLSGEGLERLVYQPDERPTGPMAVSGGGPSSTLDDGGRYLPSLAAATAAGPAGGMASDALAIARWWGRLCGGQIVAEASLGSMTNFDESGEYGLGIANRSEEHGPSAVGHGGLQVGFMSYAVCLPEEGVVLTVLANSEDVDASWVARKLVQARRSQ